MSTKGRAKNLFTVDFALNPGLSDACSILLHFQPRLWQWNSTSDTHCESAGNLKGRQGQSKNTGPVFTKQLAPITLDPTSKSTHPPSVKTRQENSTHSNCKNNNKSQQINVLDKLFVRRAAVAHFKAQHLEFIVENDYVFMTFCVNVKSLHKNHAAERHVCEAKE